MKLLRAEAKVKEYFFERDLDFPEWLRVKNSRTLIIRVDGWDPGEYKVTVEDVIRYFAHDAQNILSGARWLSQIVGDWRNIDALAHFCNEIFKVTAPGILRRTARKYGLTPRF